MGVFVVTMRPAEGEPQKMENGRPFLRSLTVEASDEADAKFRAMQQAHDIAVQYEQLPYVIESVEAR